MATTIAAVATPAGNGGLGTVRISGSDAIAVADKIFRSVSHKKLSELKGYSALYGSIVDGSQTVDEAVALVFKAPKSYTGEDVVELSVHGGDFVLNRVLRLCLDAGAVMADRGEFTKRAYLNGKMDLSQAEAVMDIISAQGEQALKASVKAHGGAITKKCREIKEKMTFAAAVVAAFSDFPDEEPEFSGIDSLAERLCEIKHELKALVDGYDIGRMVKNGIDTVIIGPPNVGKSTLMNLLSGHEKSIVTSVAGTTRDIVEETVRLGDVMLRLSDTAGIRQTDDEVEKIGVERSKKSIESADLVLAVFDGSTALSDGEIELLETLPHDNTVVILNKSDKAIPETEPILEKGFRCVVMSAKTRLGLDELQTAITEITKTENLDGRADVYINERQRNCAVRSLEFINEAIKAQTDGMTVDAVGVMLDEALSTLMEITGERVTTEVADEVFKRFCVGK